MAADLPGGHPRVPAPDTGPPRVNGARARAGSPGASRPGRATVRGRW
ncbi:hypothetical protein SCATT_p12010 (plasmid) [Streptantibioticus cattleyicolor NRRL 8057 = DSM 46488]|uniref:Uncharacterized protein n=1 Tax=Streptantibioticus cattleyicolor (strain ATCC 35852 / DSM 46488 / JCM 4925 / NBRC 14057 / NRRL 8057) TaxID=1003195 RepID=G8XF52_STREN|nr:hypothetical protein SCATT_p12010 [Streptantibioticus cattleyicolor NRRL 8057 = DSM 46488]